MFRSVQQDVLRTRKKQDQGRNNQQNQHLKKDEDCYNEKVQLF